MVPGNLSTIWKGLKPATLLASTNNDAGPSIGQTSTVCQTLVPETVAGRAPHIEILKKETQVETMGPVNTMSTKLCPLSLKAQIPAEPLGLERFQKAMEHLFCMFGHLNLSTVTTGCWNPLLHNKGHARSRALSIRRRSCLHQDPAPLIFLCVKPSWHRAHLGPVPKVIQEFQQAHISCHFSQHCPATTVPVSEQQPICHMS